MSFDNTVKLIDAVGGSGFPLAVIDGPTNRRTVRSSSDGVLELTVAHQESTENKGFSTQRTNVRITQTIPVAESDRSVKVYIQLTLSVPKEQVEVGYVASLLACLTNLLLQGEDPVGADLVEAADVLAVATRLYGGES